MILSSSCLYVMMDRATVQSAAMIVKLRHESARQVGATDAARSARQQSKRDSAASPHTQIAPQHTYPSPMKPNTESPMVSKKGIHTQHLTSVAHPWNTKVRSDAVAKCSYVV